MITLHPSIVCCRGLFDRLITTTDGRRFADISRAATKKEEKRKLAARIAESEVS